MDWSGIFNSLQMVSSLKVTPWTHERRRLHDCNDVLNAALLSPSLDAMMVPSKNTQLEGKRQPRVPALAVGPWAQDAGPLASIPSSEVRELEGQCWMAGSLGGSKSPGQLAHPPLCRTSKTKEGSDHFQTSSRCHLLKGNLSRDWHWLTCKMSGGTSPCHHKEGVQAKSPPANAVPNRGEAELEIVHSWLFAECPMEVL